MIPRIDKYGFTKYEDILGFTDDVFRPIEECLQNNLYRECVLQISPKTYEYSVCKSSEAIPGNDVYPLTDMAYPDVIGKMHCNYQKLHEFLDGYCYVYQVVIPLLDGVIQDGGGCVQIITTKMKN